MTTPKVNYMPVFAHYFPRANVSRCFVIIWLKKMKARRTDFPISLRVMFTHWYCLFYTDMVFATSFIISPPPPNISCFLTSSSTCACYSCFLVHPPSPNSRLVFFPLRGLHGCFPAGSGTSSLWASVRCAALSQSNYQPAFADVFSTLFL